MVAGIQEPTPREFDEKALAAYAEESDFKYQNAQQGETWLSRAFYWLAQNFFRLLRTPGGSEFSQILWYLFWGIVAVGAIALIVHMRYGRVLIGGKRGEHAVPVSIESEEDVDYRQALEDARKSSQLQLAARYLFLLTLQQLSNRGHVKWKKWKTSHDYATELDGGKRQGYLALSEFFESSWFGEHKPSPEELDHYQDVSNQLVDA